jgi:hypothetical protein
MTQRRQRVPSDTETREPVATLADFNNFDGLDVVVEGEVAQVSDETELHSAASAYESKYGRHFTASEWTWFGLGDSIRQKAVLLYGLAPTRALGSPRRDVQPVAVGVFLITQRTQGRC